MLPGQRVPALVPVTVLAACAMALACGGNTGSSAPAALPSPTSMVNGPVVGVKGDAVTISTGLGDVVFHVASSTAVGEFAPSTPGDIAAGDCVTASGSPAQDGSVTAFAVAVSRQFAGRCPVLARPVRGGVNGPGTGSPRPGVSPNPSFSPRPGASPGAAGFNGSRTASADGVVDSVQGTSFALKPGAAGAPNRFTVTDSTRVTRFRLESGASITTGVCAVALGTDNADGSLAAQTVILSAAVRGACPAAGARPGGGGRPTASPS